MKYGYPGHPIFDAGYAKKPGRQETMIRGIHHVAISTPNLDRALEFYRDLCGFKVVMESSWEKGTQDIDDVVGLRDSAGRQVMLRGGNACIELFEYSAPEPKSMDPQRPVCDHGHTHLALDVTDIDAVYQKFLDAGIRFHTPPKDFGTIKATYGRDPDGNVFEIQQLTDPADPAQVF